MIAHRLHEALVDLDFVRRDFLQIFEGRKTGTVIIDRDLDAEIPKPEQRTRVGAAGQRGRLGQFEREPGRVETMLVEDSPDL